MKQRSLANSQGRSCFFYCWSRNQIMSSQTWKASSIGLACLLVFWSEGEKKLPKITHQPIPVQKVNRDRKKGSCRTVAWRSSNNGNLVFSFYSSVPISEERNWYNRRERLQACFANVFSNTKRRKSLRLMEFSSAIFKMDEEVDKQQIFQVKTSTKQSNLKQQNLIRFRRVWLWFNQHWSCSIYTQ